MNQSIYQYKKSVFIRSIRVIRVPLASNRLCLLAALLLLSFSAAAQSDLPATIWESPDKLHDDLYTPGHIFSEEENDVFQSNSGFEFFAEATETYNQDDVVLRAGGTEGEGGDPTKLPVGNAPALLIAGLSVLYAMKARKGKARRHEGVNARM